jgi:hypothetical protein
MVIVESNPFRADTPIGDRLSLCLGANTRGPV